MGKEDGSVYSEGTTSGLMSTSRGSSSGSYGPPRRPNYVDPVVADNEHRAVLRSKLCVMTVLLLAVVSVATAAYLIIANEEQEDFETQFANYASEIVTVARQTADNTFEAVDAFSATVSSYTVAANMSWPYVTMPDWSVRAEHLSKLTGARRVGLVPVVHAEERGTWENYTMQNVAPWYQNSIENEDLEGPLEIYLKRTSPKIFWFDPLDPVPTVETTPGPWLVMWQLYPLDKTLLVVNFNLLNGKRIANTFFTAQATLEPTIGFLSIYDRVESQIIQPIFEEVDNGKNEKKLVGVVWVVLDWISYFQNVLTEGSDGIIVVMKNSCQEEDDVTYKINGPDTVFLGEGDQHDPQYDHLEISAPFVTFDYDKSKIPKDRCSPELSLYLYPSKELEETFHTNKAALYTTVVILIFAFTSFVFILYDHYVHRRQKKVMARVIKQDKIMANVFPAAIRDRLYAHEKDGSGGMPAGLDADDVDNPDIFGAAPLAELFPSVTVVFADIAGFTAWSSAREPPQVFMLLEIIYGAFDKIAYRHGAFKVETVGDCYVGVAGLPDPRDDHAMVAAKFARDCVLEMKFLTRKLEVTLGPDTADLELRVGMNSGQVTAGVLRGERSRFQLFGDTVNTAARMESTSKRSQIQMSAATADLVRRHGRSKWVKLRAERVACKGKGKMQTYWLETKEETRRRSRAARNVKKRLLGNENDMEMASIDEKGDIMVNMDDDEEDEDDISVDLDAGLSKTQRLVEWNVEVLSAMLQQIVTAKESAPKKSLMQEEEQIGTGGTALDEFKPIIKLNRFGVKELEKLNNPNSIDLGATAKSQLGDYLNIVAGMYRNNHYHNFEHASHVTASVRKLLSRIVSVEDSANGLRRGRSFEDVDLVDLAGQSYGIASDPLTQFAVVFSTIIHDAGHPGVPKSQLVKENTRNAQIYKKSVSEQNSVDLALELFMSSEYSDLQACIYSNTKELKRFRQLVVNTGMAIDICDKELQDLRKARWETAFSEKPVDENAEDDEDRKATIVIEHLIQASDVSHTMQHWQIYKEWNEKFFMEMYSAYRAGRADSDPSSGWYKGEIGFFDFYAIPLAKKLESCGVFGVSSHEYLNYAMANREEWERDGEQIVKEYQEKYEAMQKEMKDDSTGEYYGYSSDGMSTDCDSDEELTLDDIGVDEALAKELRSKMVK